MLKSAINGLLGVVGYRLAGSNHSKVVRFENFESLIRAYERRLTEQNLMIPPNPRRTELMARLLGTQPAEAYYIVHGLSASSKVSGDVCEFGVAQGETSALIATEISDSGRILHLFDSFEGLPKPTQEDLLKDDIFGLGSMEAYAGTMSNPETLVRARLKAVSFPEERTIVHKGFIEKVIEGNHQLPERVSFAYVDFDFYEPVRIVLEFLDKRTARGAVIVVDDYDFFSTGAKTAVDEFLKERNQHEKQYECFVPDKQYGCFAVLTKV
jgi:hypothetical protein